jgi:hypothetical protein
VLKISQIIDLAISMGPLEHRHLITMSRNAIWIAVLMMAGEFLFADSNDAKTAIIEFRPTSAPTDSSFIPGSFSYHILTNSLGTTNGFDPIKSTCLTELIGPRYTWNTNLWLFRFPEITSMNSGPGIGALGQSPGTYGMQLITQRHAIMANHATFANPVGSPITFTDKNGKIHTNYIQSMKGFGLDIAVVQFSNALPSQFIPFQLMPTNFASIYMTNLAGSSRGVRIPVVAGTYDRHLYFMSLTSVHNDTEGGIGTHGMPGTIAYDGGSVSPGKWLTNQIGYGWGENTSPLYIKTGDSSSPIMMIVRTNLVLLSSLYSFDVAPDYASASPTIQATVDALTVAAGGTNGQYKVKTIDLSSFPAYQ